MACLGADLAPTLAAAAELRIKDAKTVPSICPYCSVGCATLVHTVDGKIANIEGDRRSPHNEGTLCPKGAAIARRDVHRAVAGWQARQHDTPAIFSLGGAILDNEWVAISPTTRNGSGTGTCSRNET